jgi:PAS domain S-box-containing protein
MRERSQNERMAGFLETINRFGSILMSTCSTQESAWSATKHAVGNLGYIDCIIYLVNDDGELFQCAAHGNKNPTAQDILNPIKLKLGQGICGHVALTGISEIIADTSKDPRYIIDDKNRHSEITVPILSDGLVIGVIDCEHPERDYFSNNDLNILATIASMLSFKISQAKAIEDLDIINKKLAIQNEEKQKRADELAIANKELAFQNEEKQKRAGELAIANKKLAFQNEEKQKRADELAIANKELAFQNEEKQKRADELTSANKEYVFQNEEKQKRADELAVANKELAFQNEEKQKRANELAIANKELAFQNEEKQKRADELAIANKELAFQNEEKQKRADELTSANKEYVFQNEEKQKRADELAIANKELAFQNEEKQKRADELAIANKELSFQNEEKQKRADELAIANREKQKRASELSLANEEKQKRADELSLAFKELAFQNELEKTRIETESIAKELRQFIETANAPIFGIDNKGLINEWNQTSEKVTGFSKTEVLGQNLVANYISPDYQTQVKEVLDNALKGEETANFEFPLFAKNGKRVVVLLNSSSRRDVDGEIIGMLCVGQDITIINEYKKNLESKVKLRTQKLEESLEREKELGLLKTRFVSMASHEFRTPLTSIKTTSDIVLRYGDKLSKDDINERLRKIKREVDDMTDMLEDILIIGKSDAQKLNYNPELLNIVSLITDIITEYQLSKSENRLIDYIISSPVIMISADKKWIKHIVINLFSNATKYSEKVKPIGVSIKQERRGVSFCFRDYGIGISKEDIKHLFEPFQRGKNTQNISGTGLGLSVVKKAVELLNGKIEVESKLRKGSSFKVILFFK